MNSIYSTDFKEIIRNFRIFLKEIGIDKKYLFFSYGTTLNLKTEKEMEKEWDDFIRPSYIWLEFRPYRLTEDGLSVFIQPGEKAPHPFGHKIGDKTLSVRIKFYGY